MKISNCLLVASILFYSTFSINAAVGEGVSPIGTLSSLYFAEIDSLIIGPSIAKIKVPTNGEGYIYFSFTSDELPLFSDMDFFVSLKKPDSVFYDATATFIDQGILRLTIPSDAITTEDSIEFKLPDIIPLSGISYNLLGTPPTFIAKLDSSAFTRTWDLFAGGSAGVSGLFGSIGILASASEAKLSIKGSGGVGFKIKMDQKENLFLDRRMEFSIGANVEMPSFNTTIDQVKFKAGVTQELIIKTLVGHSFSFAGLGLDEQRKKMAQTGFFLETLSLGAMNISPIVGPLLRAVITTLNSYAGVEETFSKALLTSYWGVGMEGTLGAGSGFEAGPIKFNAIKGGFNYALNTKFSSHHRKQPTSFQKYSNKISNIGESIELTQAASFNLSAISGALEFDDGIELERENYSLFGIGVGGELALGVTYNNFGVINKFSIGLKGGGDAILNGIKRSIYYNTTIEIPGEYTPLIVNAGRSVAGLFEPNVNVQLGKLMIEDAVESFKDTYASLTEKPITFTTFETRGKGTNLSLGISLDAALGVGLGLSLGVSAKYFDEIEFPRKYTEVYANGKNYLLYSSEYKEEMIQTELGDIMGELFSGTVPLVKTAFLNFITRHEKVISAGQTFFIIFVPGAGSISSIGDAFEAGKWIVSKFSSKSPMVLAKPFELPQVRQMYYSTNVKHKINTTDSKIAAVDIETILVIVSESMNVSFTPDDLGVPVDSVITPYEVKMAINEQLLIENHFSIEDKERIKIYRYDIDSLSWILEGGELIEDTLKISTSKLGTFALGIELINEVDNKAPEIYEMGPRQGSTHEEYPEIYGKIRDDAYGFGIDISKSNIILNGDTLNTSYDPTNEKLYYKLSEQDSLINGAISITITAVDFAGNSLQETFSFELNVTAVEDEIIPKDYKLYQNYPNPFNPETVIQFEIPERANVTINIYDVLGSYITTIHSGELQSGLHKVIWNGLNSRGFKVGSGIYFYQFKTDKINIVKKMQFLK